MAETTEPSWGSTLLKYAAIGGAATAAVIVAPSALEGLGNLLAPASGTATTALGNVGEAMKNTASFLASGPTPGTFLGDMGLGGPSHAVANVVFGDPVTKQQLLNGFIGTDAVLGGRLIDGVSTGAQTLYNHAAANWGATAALAGGAAAVGYATRSTEGAKPVIGRYTAAVQGLGTQTSRLAPPTPGQLGRS